MVYAAGSKVKILAPATIANLVCGFDILGLAINSPQDEMELSLSNEPGIRINILMATIYLPSRQKM